MVQSWTKVPILRVSNPFIGKINVPNLCYDFHGIGWMTINHIIAYMSILFLWYSHCQVPLLLVKYPIHPSMFDREMEKDAPASWPQLSTPLAPQASTNGLQRSLAGLPQLPIDGVGCGSLRNRNGLWGGGGLGCVVYVLWVCYPLARWLHYRRVILWYNVVW